MDHYRMKSKSGPLLARILCLTMVLIVLDAGPAACAEEQHYPHAVFLTEADIESITAKGILRGREVCPRVQRKDDSLIWDGERVFTGKKSDIIAWFRSFPRERAMNEFAGEQYFFRTRND